MSICTDLPSQVKHNFHSINKMSCLHSLYLIHSLCSASPLYFSDKIIALQVWKPGEEVLVAVAVMNLFSLLPQASHFVESLVKMTLRLESVMPRYKPCRSTSPFREPLAKYLCRYCASKCLPRSDLSQYKCFSTNLHFSIWGRCCWFLFGVTSSLQPTLQQFVPRPSEAW